MAYYRPLWDIRWLYVTRSETQQPVCLAHVSETIE